MNIINVAIDFTNGINKLTGINLITGDYASTKMVFQFDRTEGTKVLEMKNPSGEVVYFDEIINNEVVLASFNEGLNYSIFNEAGRYIYEVSLYNGDSKLTSVKGELPVQKEQVIIDGEIVEPYLPIFDRLMQEINTALTQTDNLNIDGNKSGKITTITITYKDGTTKELSLEDGKSIEYNWQGTQLGIRQEGQSEYVYVDLKGEKGDAGAVKAIPVQTLPTEDIDDSAIYLVPMPKIEVEELPTTGTPNTIYIVTSTQKIYIYTSNQWVEISQDNNYLEYMYINNKWELLGALSMQIDLSNYVKFTDYATSSKAGVIKKDEVNYGFNVSNGGYLFPETITFANYNVKGNPYVISKGTLENVIAGKGLVSNANYASSSTGGVIKTSNYYDTEIDSSGALRSKVVSYAGYPNERNNAFISKGTLDNVLNAKIGDIQTLLDNLDTGSGV